MIAYPNKMCAEKGCRNVGTHCKNIGSESSSRNSTRFCEKHAPCDHVDIVQRKCMSCGLLDILTSDLCGTCDPVRRRVSEHAKENRVRDVLVTRGFDITSHDKMVDGGACVRYRPDFVFDAGSHFVLLEVDENQHESYPCECEQQRMVNLSQAMGMATIFIRYNPDRYKPPPGTRAVGTSAREDTLCTWLSHLLKTESSPVARGGFCDVLYLFYDGFGIETASVSTLTKLS